MEESNLLVHDTLDESLASLLLETPHTLRDSSLRKRKIIILLTGIALCVVGLAIYGLIALIMPRGCAQNATV